MASPVIRVTEVSKITPPETRSPTESSLPLTFFDTFWFKLHPVERIFFYELSAENSSDNILPRLKQSLSLTLLHFLPFAGNLIWPSHSDKPFLHYSPGDGVSLTVAESDADFHSVSGDSIREISDSHHYVPDLDVSETKAATMAFQITVFGDRGFCIGISSHHAIFDGKSIVLFIKAWAHICKNGAGNKDLPPELTPVLDRTLIQDPEGLDMVFMNSWITAAMVSGMDTNPRSLKLFTKPRSATDTNFVRGTFKLSGEDIKKIRKNALSQLVTKEDATNQENSKHFSTFVLSFAYVTITIIKAKALENNNKLILGFTADVRARLDHPVPANYFGNCVSGNYMRTEVECLVKEDGLAFVAEELTKLIKELAKNGGLDDLKQRFEGYKDPDVTERIGVAGSPRFEVYGIDFGWEKPVKVEVTSIDQSTSISMAERRDENGGVEVGVVLKKDEMVLFDSLFFKGMKDL